MALYLNKKKSVFSYVIYGNFKFSSKTGIWTKISVISRTSWKYSYDSILLLRGEDCLWQCCRKCKFRMHKQILKIIKHLKIKQSPSSLLHWPLLELLQIWTDFENF